MTNILLIIDNSLSNKSIDIIVNSILQLSENPTLFFFKEDDTQARLIQTRIPLIQLEMVQEDIIYNILYSLNSLYVVHVEDYHTLLSHNDVFNMKDRSWDPTKVSLPYIDIITMISSGQLPYDITINRIEQVYKVDQDNIYVQTPDPVNLPTPTITSRIYRMFHRSHSWEKTRIEHNNQECDVKQCEAENIYSAIVTGKNVSCCKNTEIYDILIKKSIKQVFTEEYIEQNEEKITQLISLLQDTHNTCSDTKYFKYLNGYECLYGNTHINCNRLYRYVSIHDLYFRHINTTIRTIVTFMNAESRKTAINKHIVHAYYW